MSVVYMISRLLVIVGALNWGLVALFKFDLVQAIFGGIGLAQIVYILVGICGLVALVEFIQARTK